MKFDGTLASKSYDGPVTIYHPVAVPMPSGEYQLTFPESVATCLHWLNFETLVPRLGTVRVSGDSKKLVVSTFPPAGTPADAAFTLHLAC